MAKMDFARINKSGSTSPRVTREGDEDQSYGFLPTYKVQTGNTMGDMTIKGRILIKDADGVIRLVMGYDPGKF